MTIPAAAVEIGDRLPSKAERAAANQLRRVLATAAAQHDNGKLQIIDDDGKPSAIVLTPALSSLLMALLRHIGDGDAVTLVPVHKMLTTQQAADILNVSRPYLVGLIDNGAIPHTMVGRHRRIKAEDLFAYKRLRDAERAQALSDLAASDGELI